MKNFSATLNSWYKKNKRSLPWRDTKDPYKVWLSEIILQQTRVEQGLSYYIKFTENFPTVHELAKAPEEKVMKLWQGLGYYSRARNLHAAAKQVISKKSEAKGNKSVFPNTYEEIIKLKGVGPYTAAAISSICFNEAKAVVDGNVYRFIARLHGVKTPIDSTEGKKEFQLIADELIDKKFPGEHNQAMMEFGARHCKPQNPLCGSCPFVESCVAARKNAVNQFPVKEKKTKTRTRHFEYFVFEIQGKTFLRKRENEKDIWRNLYEFPVLEFDKSELPKTIYKAVAKNFGLAEKDFVVERVSPEIRHILSHQDLKARFYSIAIKKIPAQLKKGYAFVSKKKVNDFALPRLIDRYWNKK